MKYEVELTDEQARAWERLWRPSRPPLDGDHIGTVSWALADAIRANPPKPPRMDEPGWGEKVIARLEGESPRRWVRYRIHRHDGSPATNQWRNILGDVAAWDDLIDPEPYS